MAVTEPRPPGGPGTGVQHFIDAPLRLTRWAGEDGKSRIAVTGRDLPRDVLRESPVVLKTGPMAHLLPARCASGMARVVSHDAETMILCEPGGAHVPNHGACLTWSMPGLSDGTRVDGIATAMRKAPACSFPASLVR